VTPEAGNYEGLLDGLERLSVGKSDIEAEVEQLTAPLDDPVIVLGCPHSSLGELAMIAGLVRGREMDGRLWVFTSRSVYAEAEVADFVGTIEEAGGRVVRDTCMVVAPVREMGWREVATNSFKAAHYMTNAGLRTRLGTVQELLTGEAK